MSIVTPSAPSTTRRTAEIPAEPIWRLTVEQYHNMIHTGILTEDDPVELLEGWLISKMPKNPPHRATTRLIRKALEQIVPAGWYVDSQEPITLADSEPELDVMVVRGQTRDYLDRHPGVSDLALVVEVADMTLRRDRTAKKRLYARAGIPVYWVVNLPDKRVEVYSDPSGPADRPDYRQQQNYGSGDTIPLLIEGVEIGRLAVSELLP
jgi:Uma2 family endonuclease